MIKSALNDSSNLSQFKIDVIPKGSYHNNTNVRLNSDVDVAVVLRDTFFADYPEGKNKEDFVHSSSSYSFRQYREDIPK